MLGVSSVPGYKYLAPTARSLMANLIQLRMAAREIFNETLRAVHAGEAVRRAVQFKGGSLSICDAVITNQRIYSIAVGKAAMPMCKALDQILGESLVSGVLVGPNTGIGSSEWLSVSRWRWCEGGHPLPTEASLTAATEAFALIDRANQEEALVVFLISGGGSAMMEWPIDSDITLEDLRIANQALIKSGAAIAEVNSVRRAFSAIKGGRLAAMAPNCDQITLIVSDVPAGEEWSVASGPTLLPPKDTPHALDVLERYDLRGQMPAAILRAIAMHAELPESPNDRLREYRVLLDSNHALEAAARAALRRGYTIEFARDITDGPIDTGCENLLNRLTNLRETTGRIIGADLCVVSGGEFACTVRGAGLGGRNLESALRLALAASSDKFATRNFVAVCAGTDGIDGNSPAAGAIVDDTTIERATKIGLDAHDFLNRSDAYSFFVALGDAITTGPTGTNVRDLRILLAGSSI
jgi:glycerate 2-kinase